MENIGKLSFENADCYIFSKDYHRKYFSGFSGSFGYLLVTKETAIYITDKRYEKAAKDHFEKTNFILEISQNLAEVLVKHKNVFADKKISKIGFEGELTIAEFENIKSCFSEAYEFEFENISSEIHKIRAVKTPLEIEKIARAMKVSAKAYKKFLKTVKIGQTERELRANLNHQLFLQGADSLAFETIIASGKNGAKPHATPSDRKIKKGDFVTCDFGACVDGYNADITRTFAVGELTKFQLEVYNIVQLVQQTCLDMVKPGVKTADIHNKAVQMFEEFALDKFFTHGLGHGVGVEIHEAPTLNARSAEVLEVGNVITIEPGLYLENRFGLRIEDTIVVTEEGICNLNPLSKELIALIDKKHLKNK